MRVNETSSRFVGRPLGRWCAVLACGALAMVGCGGDDDDAGEPASSAETSADGGSAEPADDASIELPLVVVTTSILGDVVSEAVGDAAEVVTIMPVGDDPHGFQASAQEVDVMMSADALIVNGAGLEESLLDVIEAAEGDGVPTFEVISAVETIEFGASRHDHADEDHADDEGDHDHADDDGDHDHADEDHTDEDHADEDGDHDHDHSGDDPHFWTDPARMASAVDGTVGFLQDHVEFAAPAAVDASAEAYVAELTALHDEIEAMVETIPEGDRKLVVNHDSLGYFADAFGFELIGAVIPGGSTLEATSGGELAELVELIDEEGVPAIFSDSTASDDLIQVLAEEAGGVVVVELLTGSLGEPDSDGRTYLDMQRTNAERIVTALT